MTRAQGRGFLRFILVFLLGAATACGSGDLNRLLSDDSGEPRSALDCEENYPVVADCSETDLGPNDRPATEGEIPEADRLLADFVAAIEQQDTAALEALAPGGHDWDYLFRTGPFEWTPCRWLNGEPDCYIYSDGVVTLYVEVDLARGEITAWDWAGRG